MSPSLRAARVRVPASTSNLGAGFDCLGLALDRWLDATYQPGPGTLRIHRAGTLEHLAGDDGDLLRNTFLAALDDAGIPRATGTISATSEIPVARGLGSSAAAVVAGLALAEAARGRADHFDRDAALDRATQLEGHPDNAAPALFGGLVAVARDEDGRPRAFRLPLHEPIGFAFAAPGVEVSTAEARATLPDSVEHATAARALGRIAALVHGLATGERGLLRIGFHDELHVPHRTRLIPGADAALESAATAGAWAATISGSGSGLIALAAPELAGDVAEAMVDAFRREAGEAGVVAFAAGPARRGAVLLEVDP